MSSCFTGAGRAYGFDFEIVKSPSSSSRTSHTSSSPSSTISESSNSPLAISTRKPRTPRKRPNQTYNEAATLLSTVYPKIFSRNHLTKPLKSTNPPIYFPQSSDLLISDFLLDQTLPEKPSFRFESKSGSCYEKLCQSPGEVEFTGNKPAQVSDGFGDDFDAESILDEEIEEGIDSILGNLNVEADETNSSSVVTSQINHSYYGISPLGLGFNGRFDFGFGVRRGVRAFRGVDEGNYWWSFPTVDIGEISPKFSKVATSSTEKKKKKVEKPVAEPKNSDSPKENSAQKPNSGLLLKLNYDKVLDAWSDKGSPFPEETSGSDSPGSDFHARLAQIDLFSENGGLREASVLRYKEKRRTRLFSKKIRYQVRKVNADRRPRMKGRFVRRPGSNGNGQQDEKNGRSRNGVK